MTNPISFTYHVNLTLTFEKPLGLLTLESRINAAIEHVDHPNLLIHHDCTVTKHVNSINSINSVNSEDSI